jgi:hypothetical protein
LEKLKATVERVKLNGLLFEQKLHIEELSASINNKQADIERITTELDAKIELGFTLESNIRFKDNELRAAKLNWNRMRSAAEPRDIAANKVVSDVTSTGKHGGADINLRASQLAQLATTNSAKQEAEAKTELLEKLKLLVLAGIQIRSRRIEWQKTNRSQDIIFLGNTTSYLSMAAAEASLYQKFGPSLQVYVWRWPGLRLEISSL